MNDQSPVVHMTPPKRHCSFCDKPESEVGFLVANGASSAFMCDQCIKYAKRALAARSGSMAPRFAYQILTQHFPDLPIDQIATSVRAFPARMRADLQLAIQAHWLNRSKQTIGVHRSQWHSELSFSTLMQQGQHPTAIGPLQYEDLDIGEENPVKCLGDALALLDIDNLPVAILLTRQWDFQHEIRTVNVEIAVPMGTQGAAITETLFRDLEKAIQAAQSYRGKVLSLEARRHYTGESSGILVHRLRTVAREQVILPERTLDQLDRNIVQFAQRREQLRGLGMSTKKGLLFYGPPGTGKTHTIHYLAAYLPQHTTLLVTAEQVGLLPEYFQLARLLQPAVMVIEDADLIARDRASMGSACEEVMLNLLLNEMDGLREDADIFFILTTNRPETLEAALAARPGRIDQAIEFPLPDEACRLKLLRLYAGSLMFKETLAQEIVRRTDGVSAAFIKELVRRIAQASLDTGAKGVAAAQHIDMALEEMLVAGGALNTRHSGWQVCKLKARASRFPSGSYIAGRRRCHISGFRRRAAGSPAANVLCGTRVTS